MVQKDTWWIVASLVREAAGAVRVHLAVMAGVAQGGGDGGTGWRNCGSGHAGNGGSGGGGADGRPEETVVMAAMETRMPSPMSPAELSQP